MSSCSCSLALTMSCCWGLAVSPAVAPPVPVPVLGPRFLGRGCPTLTSPPGSCLWTWNEWVMVSKSAGHGPRWLSCLWGDGRLKEARMELALDSAERVQISLGCSPPMRSRVSYPALLGCSTSALVGCPEETGGRAVRGVGLSRMAWA